jgi:hypothetical protein
VTGIPAAPGAGTSRPRTGTDARVPSGADPRRHEANGLEDRRRNLPAETIAGCTDAASPVCNGTGDLISRDFARGNYDGLASGQAIAGALGCPVIPASSINPTHDAVFNLGTPLLYYVLAEAQRAGQVLGCVGKSIVAQTFLQVLWDTPNSILHTSFTPDPSLVKLAPETPRFSFGDLLVDTGLAPRTS